MVENCIKTYHFDHLGGLGPKWSKLVPKLTISTIWAAPMTRLGINGFVRNVFSLKRSSCGVTLTRDTQTLQMISFGTIFDHFGSWPPRRSKWSVLVAFSTISGPGRPDAPNGQFWYHFDHFGPWPPRGSKWSVWYYFRSFRALAAQTLQMVCFGTIFDHFVLWPPRRSKWSVLVPFSTISGPGRPDAPNGEFWYHFRPFRALAAQTLQMVSFGSIFDHFGPWPPRCSK